MTPPTEQPSFADILREKMAISPSETGANQSDFAPETAPFTTESLLHLLHLDTPVKSSGYIKTVPPKKAPQGKPSRPPEPSWPISTLSVGAQLALTTLDLMNAQEISQSQVKRAYRQHARRLHPDLNPNVTTEAFTALKEAQDLILGELQELARAATKTAA